MWSDIVVILLSFNFSTTKDVSLQISGEREVRPLCFKSRIIRELESVGDTDVNVSIWLLAKLRVPRVERERREGGTSVNLFWDKERLVREVSCKISLGNEESLLLARERDVKVCNWHN